MAASGRGGGAGGFKNTFKPKNSPDLNPNEGIRITVANDKRDDPSPGPLPKVKCLKLNQVVAGTF